MPDSATEFSDRLQAELRNVIGAGTFDNFTPGVRNAVTRATLALGVTIVAGEPEEAAQKQALLEAKAVLANVKVAGMAAGGNLWDALGGALSNLIGPIVKMAGGLFGIKL